MKNVLFIGVREYNLHEDNPHLQKKFMGLSGGMHVFVIARGSPFYKRIWDSDFYLIRTRLFFLPISFVLGSYLCLRNKIDVVVCQSPLTEGIIGVALKKLFRKELIVEAHGDWEDMPFVSRKRIFESLLRKLVPFVAKTSFKNAGKIRALTNYFADRIRKIARDKKYFIFPTFTDINYFLEEQNVVPKKYILTVAVLSPIKNIETLIESFAIIYKDFPDFRLIVAGEGPSLENLKRKVKNEKLEGAVIFTGKLSLSEVREVMRNCYMFALPSLSEGFGRVFIEAMALAKPVIASNVGGIPEIVEDGKNGFLIEPKDTRALAEKLKILLSSPKSARKMGENGRSFVRENFSNEKYTQNYINMINA